MNSLRKIGFIVKRIKEEFNKSSEEDNYPHNDDEKGDHKELEDKELKKIRRLVQEKHRDFEKINTEYQENKLLFKDEYQKLEGELEGNPSRLEESNSEDIPLLCPQNLTCSYPFCKKNIKSICVTCPEKKFYCEKHSWTHNSEKGHDFRSIKQEELKMIFLGTLKSHIKSLIHKMSSDTARIIASLKKASTQSIQNLKISIKNLKKISDFKPTSFYKERISFLVSEVSLISEDLKVSPHVEIRRLCEGFRVERKKIEIMSKELEASEQVIMKQKELMTELSIYSFDENLFQPNNEEAKSLTSDSEEPENQKS